MTHEINIFINGRLEASNIKKVDFDWDWLEKTYDSCVNRFNKSGYEPIRECSRYVILFNEKLMKSAVVSYTLTDYTDFLDYKGDNIIEGKKYKGILQGEKFSDDHKYDVYTILKHPFNEGYYLRNITRSDSHVIEKNGHPMMSPCVSDKNLNPEDQEFLNKLKLKKYE